MNPELEPIVPACKNEPDVYLQYKLSTICRLASNWVVPIATSGTDRKTSSSPYKCLITLIIQRLCKHGRVMLLYRIKDDLLIVRHNSVWPQSSAFIVSLLPRNHIREILCCFGRSSHSVGSGVCLPMMILSVFLTLCLVLMKWAVHPVPPVYVNIKRPVLDRLGETCVACMQFSFTHRFLVMAFKLPVYCSLLGVNLLRTAVISKCWCF